MKKLKDLINNWKLNLFGHKYTVDIHGEFRNIPEGHYSVLLDYNRNGCLSRLINNVGCLPENILGKLSWQLIRAINFYHTKTNQAYGGLFPSQILIGENEEFKVSLFILYIKAKLWIKATFDEFLYRKPNKNRKNK
jgi:serine/threonine protein kinase